MITIICDKPIVITYNDNCIRHRLRKRKKKSVRRQLISQVRKYILIEINVSARDSDYIFFVHHIISSSLAIYVDCWMNDNGADW